MLHQTSIELIAGAGQFAASMNMSAVSAAYDASLDVIASDGLLPGDGAVLKERAGRQVANIRSSTENILRTTASGRQQVEFSNPVAVAAAATYVASHHTHGNRSPDPSYLATEHANGLLTAPARQARSSNGLVGHSSLFPINHRNATRYGADVLVRASCRPRRNTMHAEVYTDGIDEITVGGSIVRVDLVSLSPNERDAGNTPKKVFRQRLIFSVEAFANSVEVMQNALQGLVDAGVLKRNQPRTSLDAPHVGQGGERSDQNPAGPRMPNVSTNFR